MERQQAVPKSVQINLFLTTVATTFIAVATPIALSIFVSALWLRLAISLIVVAALILGVRRILRLSRTPGAEVFERASHASLTLALTGALLFGMIGGSVAHLHESRRETTAVTNYSDGSQTASTTVHYSHSEWGYVGLAIIGLALLLVFAGLTFFPSTERELKRRMDLEASSITLGTCLFFFFFYSSVSYVVPLPAFSANVAILSIIIVYLLARLVVSLRYK